MWRFVVRVASVSLRICTSKFIARAAWHVSLIMHVCERDTRRSWKSPGNKLDACQPGSSKSGNQCTDSRPFWWDSVSSGSLDLSLSLFLSALRNAIHVTICVRVWKLMSRTRKSFVGPLTSTWLVINFFWLWKGWKRVRFAKEEILFYFVIGLIEILVMIMIFCHKECSMLNIFHWLCDFYCLQLFWKNYWYRWIIYRIRKW